MKTLARKNGIYIKEEKGFIHIFRGYPFTKEMTFLFKFNKEEIRGCKNREYDFLLKLHKIARVGFMSVVGRVANDKEVVEMYRFSEDIIKLMKDKKIFVA